MSASATQGGHNEVRKVKTEGELADPGLPGKRLLKVRC